MDGKKERRQEERRGEKEGVEEGKVIKVRREKEKKGR